MSVWILIYWITVGAPGSYGGLHVATGSVEFADEAACHMAFAEMNSTKVNDSSYRQGLWGVCVSKAAIAKKKDAQQ